MTEPDGGPGAIGVFDSGVGGLTVAAELIRRYPSERLIYVADQAHVPYGGRDLAEIREFATAISDFLHRQGSRAVVMACNISSATALKGVSERLPIPVVGMIGEAARRAALGSEQPRIGVLATEGTVRSGAYTNHIKRLNPDARVAEMACPRFVPLVEKQETGSTEAYDACMEYLRPLALEGCETIVLGCTHYPYLLPSLRRAASMLFTGDVDFLDPSDGVADALAHVLPDIGWWNSNESHLLLTTGDADTFRMQAPVFLPNADFVVSQARWENGALILEEHVPVGV